MSDLSYVVVLLALLWVLFWAIARFVLRGADLSAFDRPVGCVFRKDQPASAEHLALVGSLGKVPAMLKNEPRSRHLEIMRRYLDGLFPSDALGASFTPVVAAGVGAEWVAMPGADPARRLLYIHGGAFMMGSPKSHRRLTAKLAELTGGFVLSIDYRLRPENPRLAGIEDCRSAYRWLLDHGPQGAAPASRLWVAGDSAGGNLTLSLVAWVRDSGLRAPDAAVAFSPLTDSTLSCASLRTNVRSDPMLGPMFGALARVPSTLLQWLTWAQNRVRPCDPRISPARGDLSRLPPVLVQVSEAELLRDDARRYVNRAIAAGSPVQLQSWPHLVHVWQIFWPDLPEGREALDEVGRFIAALEGRADVRAAA